MKESDPAAYEMQAEAKRYVWHHARRILADSQDEGPRIGIPNNADLASAREVAQDIPLAQGDGSVPSEERRLLQRAYDVIRAGEVRLDADCSGETPLAREIKVALASHSTVSEGTRALLAIRALVDKQAEDEALWATSLDGSTPIAEAYLRQELRRLHALVESAPPTPPEQMERAARFMAELQSGDNPPWDDLSEESRELWRKEAIALLAVLSAHEVEHDG